MEVVVVTLLGLVGLAVVLFALWQDVAVDPPGPSAPGWDPLPSRSDIAHLDFPLRVPGYDPATVDLALDLLADAYGDLLAEADPATIARARRRAQARLGGDEAQAAAPPAVSPPAVVPPPSELVSDPERIPAGEVEEDAATADALRTTMALDALRDEED